MCNRLTCIKAHEVQKKKYTNQKIRHVVYEKSQDGHINMRGA
jgi:hypothetical protein